MRSFAVRVEHELVEPFPVKGDDRAEVPHQDVDAQLGIVPGKAHRGKAQSPLRPRRRPHPSPRNSGALRSNCQPAMQMYVLGPARHFVERPEIVSAVDEQTASADRVDALAVPAGPQDPVHLHYIRNVLPFPSVPADRADPRDTGSRSQSVLGAVHLRMTILAISGKWSDAIAVSLVRGTVDLLDLDVSGSRTHGRAA